MAGFDCSVDKRSESIAVEHGNLLGEYKKRPEVKPLLVIKPFPFLVEISFGKALDSAREVLSAAEKAAEKFHRDVFDVLDRLVRELTDLQAAEKKGDAKAADKASKAVKKAEKELKTLAGTASTVVRKAVERELKALKSPVKAIAVSRTIARGLELRDDAFEGAAEDDDDEDDEDEIDPSLSGLAKAAGQQIDEVESLVKDESRARKDLVKALAGAKNELLKLGGGNKDLRLEEVLKQHPKLPKPVEDAAGDYLDVLKALARQLDKLDKPIQKLEKLTAKDSKLADNKAYVETVVAVDKSRLALLKSVDEIEADVSSRCEESLFQGDFDRGRTFDAAIKLVEGQPDLATAAKELVRVARELANIAKG
jgi:hypothetical protein